MRITIGTRLALGFLVMLLLVAATGLGSILAVGRLADLTVVLGGESDNVRRLTDIRVGVAEADAVLERAMTTGSEEDIAAAESRQSQLQEEVTAYLDSRGGAGANEMLQRLETAQQVLDRTFETYLEAATLSLDMGAEAFSQRQLIAVDPYLSLLTEVESDAAQRMSSALEEIRKAESSLLLMMIGFTFIAAIVGGALAVGITRSVTVPIGQLVETADKISVGDLDAAMAVHSQDEIGELADSMERMRISMKAAIERLRKQRQ
jgi:nitrogen fixation/metabolism regulation signal transduction histidine kinase